MPGGAGRGMIRPRAGGCLPGDSRARPPVHPSITSRAASVSRSISNIVVGRSRDCDLVLKDPTVSGRHARLAWEGDKILLEDLGSANGTFVGGKRITREHIRPGDEVRFGRAPLRWSESALRPFLRKGGKDTILGESIPGRRFICGSCGTRGVMPPGFKGGVLRCGACGQRLIVSQPGPRWPRFVMTSLALAAAAALLIWVVRGVETNPIREAAERLGLPDPGSTAASSPQEASIRIHTLDRVVAAIDTSVPATRSEVA